MSPKPLSPLLALVLLVSSGCSMAMHPLQSGCGRGMNESQWGQALDRLCTGQCFAGRCQDADCYCEAQSWCDCGGEVCQQGEPNCELDCPLLAHCLTKCSWRPGCRIEPGPPPVRFRPLMPPEFLPLPTRPIFAAVNLAAPEPPTRGAVEVQFGPELVVPGRD